MLTEARGARDKVLNEAPNAFLDWRMPEGVPVVGGTKVGPYLAAAMPLLPAILGGMTGSKLGKPGRISDAESIDAWKSAVDAGKKASLPSEKFAETQRASAYSDKNPGLPLASITKGAALPSILGGIEGAAVANAPDIIDSYRLPQRNPERMAYEEFLKRAPEGHPETQKARDLMATPGALPEDNPARRGLFKDWVPRTAQAATEGAAMAATVYTGQRLAPFYREGKTLGPLQVETGLLKKNAGTDE